VTKSRRSAAPHRVISWAFIHSISQRGAMIDGSDNTFLYRV
jgi:hypothetical protein